MYNLAELAGSTVFVPGSDAVPDSVGNGFSVGTNLGILASMTVGMELIKLAALQVAFSFGLM